MSSEKLDSFVTKTITTLQHFATFHTTSPNYTSLHLSTLHFLSFTLHYPLIWFNPFTFPTVLFHLTSLNQPQYGSPLSKHISKIMNPFTVLKKPPPFHFTSLHFLFFFLIILSTLHFTLFIFILHSQPALRMVWLSSVGTTLRAKHCATWASQPPGPVAWQTKQHLHDLPPPLSAHFWPASSLEINSVCKLGKPICKM
jgi:hypothetical protein